MGKGGGGGSSDPSRIRPTSVNHGSLSSIVSHLVRSQIGVTASGSLSTDDSERELDRQVASLLLKEANENRSNYDRLGTRAFYDPERDKTKPFRKPNTRFLGHMLKNVEDHNDYLKRLELEQLRKREREETRQAETWRTTTRRGDRDDVGDHEGKGKGRAISPDRSRDVRDRDNRKAEATIMRPPESDQVSCSRTPERRRRSSRDDQHRNHHSSTSRQRDEEHARPDRTQQDRERSKRRRRSPSRSPRSDREDRHHSRRRRSTGTGRDGLLQEEESDRKEKTRRTKRDREPDTELERERHRSSRRDKDRDRHGERTTTNRRSPAAREGDAPLDEVFAQVERDSITNPFPPRSAPPPLPSDPLPSKMDKYFSPTYDPLLDFTPAQLEMSRKGGDDEEMGLIGEGSFNEWDRMLRNLKERKEDKKLREAKEKEERRRERDRKRKERRRKKGEPVSSSSESEEDRDPHGTGLMNMKYAKRGETREWDLGKEAPT